MFWDTYPKTPPIVKFCIENAKRLNPTYDVHVIGGAEADAILASDFPREVLSTINVTQKSDILRAKLLLENGGVWMDATGLLHEPLEGWLGSHLTGGMTAISDPKPCRAIGAWFMAAEADSTIMTELYGTVRNYWSTPKMRLPTDEAWLKIIDDNYLEYVSDHSAHVLRIYPYFFFNYLVARSIAKRSKFAALFRQCSLITAPDHRGFSFVQRALTEAATTSSADTRQAKVDAAMDFIRNAKTPMSKLTWKRSALEYPFEEMRRAIENRSQSTVAA